MAYEYDHDCPFEAYITNLGKYNEGELVGEWVKFPTTSEELQKVFERIGIGSKDDFGNPYEEWFISDYDCYVDGLYEKLGEYENLDELNYLASKLDELDDHDYNHFQAAMQISDYTGSIKDVINLIDNLDKYEIYGKKDNSLSVSEAKELRSMKKQGRRRIYKNQAVAATVRKTTIKNEDDNSGTDSLNAGLAAVETGIGKVREHGQARKYSSKIHNRSDHLDAVQGARGAKEAGEAGESTMSATVKKTHKKLMQREFAEAAAKKQAKEAANGAGKISKKLTDQAEDLMGRLAEMLKEFCEDHPVGMIIAVAILSVVLVISGALTSCSALGSGINSGTVATSFTAEDDDIRQVEADYVALETALQNKVDSIETDHPGYDEYNYSLSEISHNPFELAALLTVLYENYTPSEVQSKLQTIFDYQYTLTSTEVVEIRTRTETRWHYVTHYRDEERTGYRLVNGHLESYTYTVSVPYEVYEPYEVEVEYEYKILNTTLTNNGISAAVSALNLTQDQMERYTLLLETRGNKPDIFGDNVYANPGVSEEYERYAVPGEYLTDQQFSNMHREAEKYLGYPYVWGGSSPGTSFDCSGFVSYVINNCGNGWNYGRLTANGWKNATARVAASDVKPGDLVFFQETYNTTGASHVGIVVDPVNKIMIHCGNPIQYASYDTPYWRAHAYCYGRIQ